jgi:ribonuclease HII
VDDSKKLSRKMRETLAPLIEERFEFAFGAAGPREVETSNVYWARYAAMRRAVMALARRTRIGFVIVDGNRTIPGLPNWIDQKAYPKADSNIWEVSCASILAKVRRDNLMSFLASREKYSHYGWQTNAGYYTPEHRRGIMLHGPTAYHRRTFDLFKYSMFSREEHERFLAAGGTSEAFFLKEAEQKAYDGFLSWKNGMKETP